MNRNIVQEWTENLQYYSEYWTENLQEKVVSLYHINFKTTLNQGKVKKN